jgi:hypothetical protein
MDSRFIVEVNFQDFPRNNRCWLWQALKFCDLCEIDVIENINAKPGEEI